LSYRIVSSIDADICSDGTSAEQQEPNLGDQATRFQRGT
jgi:hypothetical protein